MTTNPEYDSNSTNTSQQQRYIDKLSTQKAESLYYEAIDSVTEETFEATCQKIRDKHPQIGIYMDNTWWPYKKRIVKVWTDKIMHFDQQSTF